MTKKDALPYSTILLFDIAERDRTVMALITEGSDTQIISKNVRAQELPKLIDSLLGYNKLLPSNIDALGIIKRNGSMTAIRIGTAVVNTLAWLNNTPIIEITAKSIDDALDKIENNEVDRVVKTSLPYV